MAKSIDTCEEPSTYEELVGFEDSSKCMIAMQEEVESLHKNGIGDIVTPQKYPRIFIIKIIIYSGYNWANLGIILFYFILFFLEF